MTLSEEMRRTDALALLKVIFWNVGDAPIDCTFFDSSDATYAGFKSTSWEELCSDGLLLKKIDALYALTPKGWSEALLRAGVHSTPEFATRIGHMAKSLKDEVKGRHQPAIRTLDHIVSSSGLPHGWVFNVIDSHLICRLHGKRDASWLEGARGRVVEIPRDFGLIEIDLFADVRAENLKLHETVERIEELYSDFRCRICAAPLIARHEWEHQYGWEEASEYACGRTQGAPNGDVPCAQSPEFPKFEDFVLLTKQEGDIWFCFAHGSKEARVAQLIQLPQTHGRSEEEAKEKMREAFIVRSRPWNSR